MHRLFIGILLIILTLPDGYYWWAMKDCHGRSFWALNPGSCFNLPTPYFACTG